MAKVYTRTGDGGASSLFSGERRPKTDVAFAALGAVDEANAFVGAAAEEVELAAGGAADGDARAALLARLRQVQSRLLDAGSALATPAHASQAHAARAAFPADAAAGLEAWIDDMDASLPPLANFILPGGGRAAAALHVARTAVRRAERAALAMDADCPAAAAVYLNRLSDFLFVAARLACQLDGRPEVVYQRTRPPRAPRTPAA